MLRDSSSGGTAPAWLLRYTPEDWIRQGLSELLRAEKRLLAHDRTAGVLGLRRAAGMALNGALAVHFREWGRTYVDHLRAIAEDESVPEPVRDAAKVLASAHELHDAFEHADDASSERIAGELDALAARLAP